MIKDDAETRAAKRIDTLQRVIGCQALEIDFLKRTLMRLKELPGGYGHNWRKRVLKVIQIEEELAKPLVRTSDRVEIGWPAD